MTKYLGCFRKRSGFLGDDSCIENAGTKRRKLRKRVTRDKEEDNEENLEHKEILEDMGLNILSDNSNSCDTMQHPHNSRSQTQVIVTDYQVMHLRFPNLISRSEVIEMSVTLFPCHRCCRPRTPTSSP